jgi:hypothetical protein
LLLNLYSKSARVGQSGPADQREAMLVIALPRDKTLIHS